MVFRDMSADGTVRLTGGLPEEGLQGEPGPPGPPGPRYEEIFTFSVANNVWVCQHDQTGQAVIVETYDSSGDLITGNVRIVDANTIQIEWYFPMTGTARVHT